MIVTKIIKPSRTEQREQERRQALADLVLQQQAALARLARICPPNAAHHIAAAIEQLDAAVLKLANSDIAPADEVEMDA